MSDINLGLGASLPGETALTALLNFGTKFRETMAPSLRDRLDAVTVQQAEDIQFVWRKLWVDMGLIKADPTK